MQQSEQECSCALPPVCGEPGSEVAYSVMVQSVSVTKEQQTLLARTHLNLFTCCFKIKAGADECYMRVFWQECKAYVGCHR